MSFWRIILATPLCLSALFGMFLAAMYPPRDVRLMAPIFLACLVVILLGLAFAQDSGRYAHKDPPRSDT